MPDPEEEEEEKVRDTPNKEEEEVDERAVAEKRERDALQQAFGRGVASWRRGQDAVDADLHEEAVDHLVEARAFLVHHPVERTIVTLLLSEVYCEEGCSADALRVVVDDLRSVDGTATFEEMSLLARCASLQRCLGNYFGAMLRYGMAAEIAGRLELDELQQEYARARNRCGRRVRRQSDAF
jgi:hypothetical protein